MRRLLLGLCAIGGFNTCDAAEISPSSLHAQMQARQAPYLLDVRTAEEFRAGHIFGAKLIPHDQLSARLTELGAPGKIVVYCRSGRRARLAAEELVKHGFETVELAGSFQAWDAAGLPVQRQPGLAP